MPAKRSFEGKLLEAPKQGVWCLVQILMQRNGKVGAPLHSSKTASLPSSQIPSYSPHFPLAENASTPSLRCAPRVATRPSGMLTGPRSGGTLRRRRMGASVVQAGPHV